MSIHGTGPLRTQLAWPPAHPHLNDHPPTSKMSTTTCSPTTTSTSTTTSCLSPAHHHSATSTTSTTTYPPHAHNCHESVVPPFLFLLSNGLLILRPQFTPCILLMLYSNFPVGPIYYPMLLCTLLQPACLLTLTF
jgi:hypothetical protein